MYYIVSLHDIGWQQSRDLEFHERETKARGIVTNPRDEERADHKVDFESVTHGSPTSHHLRTLPALLAIKSSFIQHSRELTAQGKITLRTLNFAKNKHYYKNFILLF